MLLQLFLRYWYEVDKTNIQVFLILNRLFNNPIAHSIQLTIIEN